MDGRR
jgi:hypothetical protein